MAKKKITKTVSRVIKPRGRARPKAVQRPKVIKKQRALVKKKRTTQTRHPIKQQSKPTKPSRITTQLEIGTVTHYFPNIGVGIIEIAQGLLHRGDKIKIKGSTTDFTQTVTSMQRDHQSVDEACAGQVIGMKMSDRVREHDKVYLSQKV